MQSDEDFWKDYCEKSKNKTIDSLVLKVFDFIRNQEVLDILDVGAGAGINANYLLMKGHKVYAIDSSPSSIQALKVIQTTPLGRNLNLIAKSFEEITKYDLPEIDMIVSLLALPFCQPDSFDQFWKTLIAKIKTGGIFAGHFFGIKHGFKQMLMERNIQVTLLTKRQLRYLLSDFEILYWKTIDNPNAQTLVANMPFRNHTHHIIAKKI